MIKSGRHLKLSPEGEVMMSYARRLLALNDEALRALEGEILCGEIRLGMQEDFGESLMPGILSEFKRHYPELRIIARVARNQELLDELDSGTLDMALLWRPEHMQREVLIRQFQLEWIHHPEFDIGTLLTQGEPLPLVMFDNPCIMRSRATACLDKAGIPWRIIFVSHSLSGVWAAVKAGLGVTVRTRIGMPHNLCVSGSALPQPGALGVSLEHVREDGAEDNARIRLGKLIEKALLST